jgi:tripartite-type tricarboxylate transporter receptor subunit TctC
MLHLTAGAATLPLLPRLAAAQAWPSRPVRWVVGFAPAGGNDIIARLMGQWLSERTGQQFIVENKPGAATNIATEIVVNAIPDGYTILLVGVSAAINATLYDNLSFNFLRDIAPAAGIMGIPLFVATNPLVPASTLPEFIAYAKARPGKINMGSAGIGSAGHLAGELFKTMAGVDMVHIPYKGAAPAVTDLLAGHVSLMFDNLASGLPNIKGGRVRALAVTTLKRSPFLPELPTISESGLRGFDIGTWFGVFAPAGTPREVVTRLTSEISRVLATPVMKERLATLGAEAMPNTPEAFAAFVKAEMAKYREIVRVSGATAD